MSTWTLALAALGLFAGLQVVIGVLVALERVHRPLREIERLADDTLAAGLGIARNLDAVDEAEVTRDLVVSLPGALQGDGT